MRRFIESARASEVLNLEGVRGKTIVITAIDAGIQFYFSNNIGELQSVDGAGVPQGGIIVETTRPAFAPPHFKDRLFGRASADGFVDIQIFNVY